jgi:hypothetical protein
VTNPSAQWPAPAAGACGQATGDLLAGYAAGAVAGIVARSVEAHLIACAKCRSALATGVDAERLARNRSVLLVRAALPGRGRVRRLLCRCGVPDHLLRLLAATPSLRLSWLLSVVGILVAVTGETVLARHGRSFAAGLAGPGGFPGHEALVPLLLVAPLLPLAGVAAAFLPLFDPAGRLAVAAPFSGFVLLLVRAVSALAAALVPAVCAAFVVPGPRWLPAALVLPALALSAFALAAVTVVGPLAAAIGSGVLWVLPVLALSVTDLPLMIVQWHGQAACALVLIAAMTVLLLRHDRFEYGWTR